MPYDDPDPTDPMTLHGVELSIDESGAVREMAECFIEEFIRLGHSPAAILDLFLVGGFAGPALALEQMGRVEIQTLIHEQFQRWGGRGLGVKVEQSPAGTVSLPVLNP
ncbi:MAG: hypothetical protein IPK83_02730 [Planctomycetes bacterium]|nr:hypothetical protein [Planctomycetota bacterium]